MNYELLLKKVLFIIVLKNVSLQVCEMKKIKLL